MRVLAALLGGLALGGLHVPATAGPAGEITHVSGAVVAQKANGQSKILSVKSSVDEGDVLATSDNAYARVKFTDGSEAVLRPATQVKIDRFNFEEQKPQSDGMVLSLLKGGMRAVTGLLGKRNPAAVRVATPSATIGIRGTTFTVVFVPGEPEASAANAAPESIAKVLGPGALEYLEDYLAEQAAREPAGGLVRTRFEETESLYREKVAGRKEAHEFLAQAPAPRAGGLAPGLYVSVVDGLINLTNKGGSQNFSAGQFGYTASFRQPPIVLPSNPGIQFTPPPSFNSAVQGNTLGKGGSVDCEVR
ncbi:MAG TPA: FecR family protein [Steroidobacteraceae bacterium]|nr:FecR family protein [Steroidobacteraceae bacterium]